MRFRSALTALPTLALCACAASPSPVTEPLRPRAALAPAEPVIEGRFATSLTCALCHSNSPDALAMREQTGADAAPFDLWRSSMMANASRDPVWRAALSVEIAATPSRAREIEAKCLRCHAPMAWVDFREQEGFGTALLEESSPTSQLALDGASCALCHQISGENLGEPSSWSGGFVIGAEREIHGPHEDVVPMPMLHHTGFRPVFGEHGSRSSLCATCHTLFTEAFDPAGEPTRRILPEQTPYLEWRNSAYRDEGPDPGAWPASCQACHMPGRGRDGAVIETAIARNPHGSDFGFAEPRRPFGRHLLVGGNYLVPRLARENAYRLRPPAPADALDTTAEHARRQLRERTAAIEIGTVERRGAELSVPVRVRNLTGHKFPTGHPSRRAWLRLQVRAASGTVVFDSGAWDDRGRLVDLEGAVLPSERAEGPVQTHLRVADGPSRVQIYEAVMAAPNGEPTWLLLRGASYAKDNRLLPRGWRSAGPDVAPIAPAGLGADEDFSGDGDELVYRVLAPPERGPFVIRAVVAYQVVGARYLAELMRYDTPEVRSLREWLPSAPEPVVVASAVAEAIR